MAAKKGGLKQGRGLESLLGSAPKKEVKAEEVKAASKPDKEDKKAADEKTENAGAEEMISISAIIPNAEQPRKDFDENAINELSESISLHGVIQPLIVQKKGNYYEIIAGERRWRAAKKAGLKKVPVIVREYSPQEAMEISLIENIQRQDLNPIEEAKAYKKLLDEYKYNQNELAGRVSKSRSAITNTLRLLKLDDEIQKMLSDGRLSAGHARALLGISDKEKQLEAANKIVNQSLSVRETEKLVTKLCNPKEEPEPKDPQMENLFHEMEGRLRNILGTKVSIKQKKGDRGTIEIEYYSMEDIDRIAELIGKEKEDKK